MAAEAPERHHDGMTDNESDRQDMDQTTDPAPAEQPAEDDATASSAPDPHTGDLEPAYPPGPEDEATDADAAEAPVQAQGGDEPNDTEFDEDEALRAAMDELPPPALDDEGGGDEPPPPPPPAPPTGPARAEGPTAKVLERNLDRSIVGGVAAGLGDYWGISPTWIRLGFAVLTVFGFAGVFVYGAAWILIPPNDGTESIADSLVRRLRQGDSWVGAALIALAALIVIGSLDFVSGQLAFAIALFVLGYLLYRGVPDRSPPPARPPDRSAREYRPLSAETSAPEVEPTAPPPGAPSRPRRPAAPARAPRPLRPPSVLNRVTVAILFITVGVMAIVDMNGTRLEARHYFATSLAIIAGALLVGTWRGRARLMILPGLVLLLPAFFLSFTSLTFDDTEIVDIRVAPTSAEELASTYRYDAGQVVLDLSGLAELPGRRVEVDLDAGSIEVILPASGHVRVVSRVGAGSVSDVGYEEGLNVSRRVVFRGPGPQLELDLTADFGAIDVYRVEER